MTHLVFLLIYSGLQIALGLWIARRVLTAQQFFVAGRLLGPGLIFATMLAANIGAGSTVGAAGLGYRDGLSAWWWVGSAGLGSLVLAFWVGPAIRRLAATHDFRTLGDFLEWRYGAAVRGIVTALLLAGTLAILAGQLIALAWILNVVAGIGKVTGCLIGGAVMTTYFAAGGLRGSAAVNLVQLVVLLFGFGMAIPLALIEVGGWDGLRAAVPAGSHWDLMSGGQSGWFYLAMLGPAFFVSPGLLQKIYGARDDRAVRLGVGFNALALLCFAVVPPLLGLIARALYPGLENHELALPTLLTSALPPQIGALGLAALFSAEISTADALLFMFSTSLAKDLYKRFLDPAASEPRVLRVARVSAVIGGALGVLLAIVSQSIVDALTIFYTLLTVSLFVPVLAGLYVRRAGRVEALAAIVCGVTVALTVQLATGGRGFGWVTPALVGILAAVAAAAIALLARGLARTAT
jgi:solute:Na+ symporter, SSS family